MNMGLKQPEGSQVTRSFLRNLPVQSKISLLILAISGTALVLFSLISVVYQIQTLRDSAVDKFALLSRAVAHFHWEHPDSEGHSVAELLLGFLKEDEDIELAVLYNNRDEVFGVYNRSAFGLPASPPGNIKGNEQHFFREDSTYKLKVFIPIYEGSERLGTLYAVTNLNRLKKQVLKTVLVLISGMIFFFFAAHFVSRRMQRSIYEPFFTLAGTAREITEFGDYSVRVDHSRDEIGDLIGNFNTMLDAIQERDNELHQHRHNLELLVEDRTEELRRHRDEAVASAQAKTEFLANMSHEIRTPMNGVIGVISLLKDAPLPDEYRRLLGTAIKSADSVMYVINDILDFSKIDAGILEFESIPFDLRELMDETAALFVDSVNSQKLDIVCFVPLDVHCLVAGDPARLRQILNNLVNNAVKFTPEGQITLKVERIEIKDGKQLLRFVVADTGIGISEKVIPRLFDKFTQAEESTTRQYGGTGLGLNVCKQLVELQGGDIGVSSAEKRGSEFWFTLPFKVVPESVTTPPCTGLENLRILVVDNNETTLEVIEHYLSACRVTVSSFKSGKYALRFLEQHRGPRSTFDKILIDHYMPEMDGIQLAAAIKERYREQTPEMFMLSPGSLGAQSAFLAGFKDVIYKPVRIEQLYDTLSGRKISRARSNEERWQSTPVSSLKGRVLLVDDEPINRNVARAILEKFGLETDTAINGQKALDLFETNDYDVILMDLQMPEINGYEATRRIREQEAGRFLRRTTIIAMTANALESTRARCFEVGMDDYISKPIKPESLAARLSPWLRPGTSEVPADEEEQQSLEDVPDTLAARETLIWDRERSLQFVGGDIALLNDLTRMFLERNEILLRSVEDAIYSGNPAQLDDAAHTYKGAVNHFWAESLQEVAFELEAKGKSGNMSGSKELFAKLERMSVNLVEELNHFIREGREE